MNELSSTFNRRRLQLLHFLFFSFSFQDNVSSIHICFVRNHLEKFSRSLSRKNSDRIAYLFDPAFPEVPIPGMMEAQIQVPGLAMVILFRVLAHVALLSDPGKPGDTQNEFAQT